MSELVHPMPGQQLLAVTYASSSGEGYESIPGFSGQDIPCCPVELRRLIPRDWRTPRPPGSTPGEVPVTELAEATALTSAVAGTGGARHRLVLDIDHPAQLIPSRTPGHSHLLIDREMSWADYGRILQALGLARVTDAHWTIEALRRGHSAVYLPGYPR